MMLARVLALVAILALLAGPVNAVAAAGGCVHMSEAAAAETPGMAISAAPIALGAEAMAEMPCCHHDASTMLDLGCLAACAAMAGVVADLPQAPSVEPPAYKRRAFPPARVTPLMSHPPPGLERPPRPTA